jgi:transposase
VFVLTQALASFDSSARFAQALTQFFQGQIGLCDEELDRRLSDWRTERTAVPPAKARKHGRNAPKIAGCGRERYAGYGSLHGAAIDERSGTDEKLCGCGELTAWLGLCPVTKVSGGKVLSAKTPAVAIKAARAFRLATLATRRTQADFIGD